MEHIKFNFNQTLLLSHEISFYQENHLTDFMLSEEVLALR